MAPFTVHGVAQFIHCLSPSKPQKVLGEQPNVALLVMPNTDSSETYEQNQPGLELSKHFSNESHGNILRLGSSTVPVCLPLLSID